VLLPEYLSRLHATVTPHSSQIARLWLGLKVVDILEFLVFGMGPYGALLTDVHAGQVRTGYVHSYSNSYSLA
jgi:hypothetical protein